jgi:4-diphosphocytidyl-2-C-methyl-D-erythritol kinase
MLQLPVTEWKHRLVNDFENSVFDQYPEIGRIKEKMYDSGAVYAAMSGSGSSVYGIFNELPETNFPDCFVWKAAL